MILQVDINQISRAFWENAQRAKKYIADHQHMEAESSHTIGNYTVGRDESYSYLRARWFGNKTLLGWNAKGDILRARIPERFNFGGGDGSPIRFVGDWVFIMNQILDEHILYNQWAFRADLPEGMEAGSEAREITLWNKKKDTPIVELYPDMVLEIPMNYYP